MRRSILCLLLLAFFACKKSTYNEQPGNPEDLIEGNWKLIQYYRDNSDGSGQWLPVDTANVQTVEFSPGGKFSHNKNFVIQETIDRFEFMKPNEILLYSSHASDSAKY